MVVHKVEDYISCSGFGMGMKRKVVASRVGENGSLAKYHSKVQNFKVCLDIIFSLLFPHMV